MTTYCAKQLLHYFCFQKEISVNYFLLWLVGCCTKVIEGGNPLLAGRQLVELRLGRQRHLQDPPRQGHFKDFQSKLRLDKNHFVLQQDLQDLQDPPGQGHFKDFDRNDSWRTLSKWLLPFFNQCFELIFRHSFVGFQQDGQDGSLTI